MTKCVRVFLALRLNVEEVEQDVESVWWIKILRKVIEKRYLPSARVLGYLSG